MVTELPFVNRWTRHFNEIIAAEISRLTRYCDCLIQWQPLDHDNGYLLEKINCKNKLSINDDEHFPNIQSNQTDYCAILLNGTLNHHMDIQTLLERLKNNLIRSSRLLVVTYNPYLRWIYKLANLFGIRKSPLPHTFITYIDLRNFARLSGFEIVRIRPCGYIPWRLFGIGSLLNGLIAATPFFRWFSYACVIMLRPVFRASTEAKKPSLSVIIPARNELGNIEHALKKMPDFGADLEVIFVEGNSTDGTWDEIQRVSKVYAERFRIKSFKQPGKGKNDAVRVGIREASNEVVTILDADLTMPPEFLKRFYDAYCLGQADFINGTRLVYPMEGKAMRFLNHLGNIFFAKALSFVLETKVGDSLCGTKLFSKKDYERMTLWRADFGDFDPFGDFELIFPAAVLGLGVVDIPVPYKARTYGSTNISRFRDGLMLFKMTAIGFFRITCGSSNARNR